MDETQKKNETQKKMLYKEAESSQIMGISYAYLKLLRRRGLISWVQVGRSVRYRMSDLQSYVERNLKIADVENSL
jgi:hypothetical protein